MSKMCGLYTVLFVASVAVLQVSAIGKCNNAVIKNILETNDFCPDDTPMLQHMWDLGGAVSFRVMTQKYYEKFSCVTGILEKPKHGVAVLHNKFTWRNESMPPFFINYTMADSTCGLNYKHVVERDYVQFKIAFGYFDGMTLGYHGCTNEEISTLDLNEQYAQCYTVLSTETSPEIEESLARCKRRMESVVPGSKLVIVPPCDNNNEYLALREKKRPFKDWIERIFSGL